MFEDTNQTPVDTSPAVDMSGEDFFDPIDFSEAGENPPTQEADDEGTSQPEAEPVADSETAAKPAGEENKGAEASYTIKYNGKEETVTLEQLLTLAQKGRDYDFVRQERDTLKNAPEIALLDAEARRYGMNRAEYLANIEKSRISEEIKAKYPEMPPEAVAEMAELQLQQKRSSNLEQSYQQQVEIERLKLQIKDEITQIMRENNLTQMPQEVLDAIAKGKTPTDAWVQYDYKKTKAEIAALKQNEANRKASPPSAKDTQAADISDDFLAGLYGKK